MNTWEIVGIKNISYEKKDGRRVSGREIQLLGMDAMQSTNSSVCAGVEVKTCWLSERVQTPLNVGQLVAVVYNERGQVDELLNMEKS